MNNSEDTTLDSTALRMAAVSYAEWEDSSNSTSLENAALVYSAQRLEETGERLSGPNGHQSAVILLRQLAGE